MRLSLTPISSCFIFLASAGIKGVQHYCPVVLEQACWIIALFYNPGFDAISPPEAERELDIIPAPFIASLPIQSATSYYWLIRVISRVVRHQFPVL